MKQFLLILSLSILITTPAFAQKTKDVEIQKTDYSPLVASLETTLGTLYLSISGDKNEKRDWDLFTFLFKDDAKLITTGVDYEGKLQAKYMTPAEYTKSSKSWMLKNGFYEKEIHRIVHTYGNITQVFSTFEAYHSEADKEPFTKGINSIQLMYDGTRWYIINLMWTNETKDKPIPAKYLPQDENN
ncbi:hypothetical protein [Formosa algae]|uniref:SnoaL-like domain-containing protein n=1 Tax=Formosa algae TaxID=225843 RepID=A0A9X1C9G5_9FLAO|nr:hypothetical protein [Formosa algae]MBP1840198.1 hypothetical protein [Formosa algae]MDQ0335798.1 hypothetical protein [Formosa algae]OEI81023.1 hypothetical protein AST99_06425 [Formosa algae]PNW26247.1 hypothetical protein BKP44_17720 [Formosa algae]